MTQRRILILANEAPADRPAGIPEVVRRQVLEADEVRVVAPVLTSRLQSWCSDIDAAAATADERLNAIVGSIHAAQPAVAGRIGDEDEVNAVADALAEFPAEALILAVHTPDAANYHERRIGERLRARFALPVTEMLLDAHGRVVSLTTNE